MSQSTSIVIETLTEKFDLLTGSRNVAVALDVIEIGKPVEFVGVHTLVFMNAKVREHMSDFHQACIDEFMIGLKNELGAPEGYDEKFLNKYKITVTRFD